MKPSLLDVYVKGSEIWTTTFLYEMLKGRDPTTAISHEKMPTFEQHAAFVNRKPYKAWYVIMEGNNPVGNIYLTDRNEIGVHIKASARRQGYATWAVNQLMNQHGPRRYFFNVSPNNMDGQDFLHSLGIRRIAQITRELDTRPPSE